jgi:antitoxin (DNA-binding transcriptional repressor) of toxin-antitoxin stability system
MAPRGVYQRKTQTTVSGVSNGHVPGTPEEASANLAQAIQAVRLGETRTLMYADAVVATKHCLRLNMRRAEVSKVIRDNMAVEYGRKVTVTSLGQPVEEVTTHKGSGARFIFLARISLGQYIKGERTLPPDGIEVGGKRWSDPVDLLRAQVVSFTATYRAFNTAVKPPTRDISHIPESILQSADEALKRLTLPVRIGEDIRRVPVWDDADAMSALFRAMMQSPTIPHVLSPGIRRLVTRQVVHEPAPAKRRRTA